MFHDLQRDFDTATGLAFIGTVQIACKHLRRCPYTRLGEG